MLHIKFSFPVKWNMYYIHFIYTRKFIPLWQTSCTEDLQQWFCLQICANKLPYKQLSWYVLRLLFQRRIQNLAKHWKKLHLIWFIFSEYLSVFWLKYYRNLENFCGYLRHWLCFWIRWLWYYWQKFERI